MTKKLSISSLLVSLLLSTAAQAGYVEINTVGDKRESYRVAEANSTSTDSKVPQQESQEAIYYTPQK